LQSHVVFNKIRTHLEERVVEIRMNTLGLEHPDTLDAMRNLVASYTSQKRWNEALKPQETVLKTRARVMGEEHPGHFMGDGEYCRHIS
jgi:hypothetical protein